MRGSKTFTIDLKSKRLFVPTAEGLPPNATGLAKATETPFPLGAMVVQISEKTRVTPSGVIQR